MFFEIGVFKVCNVQTKKPVLESLFSKVANLETCNFIKKRLLHRCFPVKNGKFFRKFYLKKTTSGCFCTLNSSGIIYIYIFHFKVICNRKTYFINYNNKRKKTLIPPTFPSLRLLKTNPFCLLPRLKPLSPSPTQRLNQIKFQEILVFKTFSTCCHFVLYIACFFFIV